MDDRITGAALIFGIVSAARQRWPKLDGLSVLLLSLGLGVGWAFLENDIGYGVRKIIIEGLEMGLGAIGFASGIGYAGKKFGLVQALGPVFAAVAPDTTTTTATVTKTEPKTEPSPPKEPPL